LGSQDVRARDLSKKQVMALSATRSLEATDEMPFTVFVFSAEDILRNGFVTLADVLKAAPGIRVSQPGNTVEGETWMARGLSGNQYMKVLINDVPLKPSVTLGMPVGAQLPVRQAERIEVMYGPASAIYGDEACAGVVNIILKESERPVYTQADLGFGRFGYNSLDLMFGGKIGKDKKIFRFSLYGSSTVRDRTDVYYDENIYNTNLYLPFGLDSTVYRRTPNFRPSGPMPGDSLPRFAQIPHESRLFGINLTWRGLHFTYHRMLRFEHTSLGLSPLAAGYANPSNQISERIETFSLGFLRERRRRTTYNNVSFQRYTVGSNSNSTHIFDRLSAASYQAKGGPGLSDTARATLLRQIYQAYASEERFATANGFDLRMESRSTWLLGSRKRLRFDAGAQMNTGGGVPLVTYNSVPLEVGIDGSTTPRIPQSVNFEQKGLVLINTIGFAQFSWRSPKWQITGGGSASARTFERIAVAPRLGALYHIDSTWTVRGNIATGYRHASLYGNFHTYLISSESSFEVLPNASTPQTETFSASELALRYSTRDGAKVEAIFFWQEAQRLYRPGYLLKEPSIANHFTYGFQNATGLAMSNWGLQWLWRTRNNEIELSVNGKKSVRLDNRLDLFVQYTKGREQLGYGLPNVQAVRNQPRWHTQMRYYFVAAKKFELVIAANWQSGSLSKASVFEAQYELPERPRLEKFVTWDLMTRLFLSNHFLMYFQMTNAFNRHHAGIDATGTPDDLLYNPQQGRQWRIGVNYNMN
jgi:hemoglobin/transferrin/lactoferrin receptor protein